MKLLLALAFLAVASAVPRPGYQPIQLPAPAAPEVIASDDFAPSAVQLSAPTAPEVIESDDFAPSAVQLPAPIAPEVIESDDFAPSAVNVVSAPLEDAQDPANYFQYAPVDTVNVIDSADDQARQFVMSMIDFSPMFVSEDVMRAVREAAEKIQSVQLPEPFVPETFEETVDAVKIADEPVFDAPEFSFEPVNVVDGPIKEEVETASAKSLSFEPVAVEANIEEVFDGSVDAVNVVDAPISELSFEPVPVEANNEVYETPVEAVRVAEAPEFNAPVDAVKVVDIAEENFQKIAPSELEAVRIAPWQVENVPQDFIPQLHFPIRYPNPMWR